MTGPDDRLDADDHGPGTGAGIDEGGAAVADGPVQDALFDRLLAGGVPEADDPEWSRDLVRLVLAAQAPARPDELAGQHEIVSRMVEARRAAREDLTPVSAPTADAAVVRLPARRPNQPWPGRRRRGPRVGVYHAKHAAARLEASRHPAVRNLGRVLAVKAAAVTTAVVVGTVAAAAAATTGLVATVVVPAFTSDDPAPSERAPSRELDDGRVGTAGTNDDSLARRMPPPVPSTDCGGDPGDAGRCAVQPAPTTASSTVPSTTATTSPDDLATTPEATTTTTTAPPPTTAPPATTVPEPPTTTPTTVPEDPPPTTPLSEATTRSVEARGPRRRTR